MRRILFVMFLAVVVTVLSSPGFARENIPADVASPGQLSVDGGLNGVSLTGLTTLLVGTLGGAEKDIFTSNISLATVPAAVSSSSNLQGTVVFNSSSTVYGDMGATGTRLLYIQSMAGTTVNFLGSVYSGTLDSATGTTNFMGPVNIVATNFTGDGTISLVANATLTGAMTTNTAQTGTLSLAGGSELFGAVGGANGVRSINVVGGSNSAGVNATISGAVDTYAFSLGTNTLNISGALTMASNGVIDTILFSPSVFGHVVVTGGPADLGTGLALNVNIPSTSLIKVGDQFNVVQGSGSGAIATVADPTNPLYKFSIVTTPAGQGQIQTSSTPLQAGQNQPIAAAVIPVLEAIPTTPDINTVLTSINALTNANAVANAEAQLAPSTPALSAPLVIFQGIRQYQDLWLSRLDMCSHFSTTEEENTNCQDNAPVSGWWAKGFGNFANQSARNGFTEYDSRTYGSMIAYDVPIGLNTRAGLGLGYGRSTINGKTFDANVDMNTYQTTAYIGHENGPWFTDASASFGWNDYSGMRHIVYPGVDRTANSRYQGQNYTFFTSSGYHLAVKKFVITPIKTMQYSRLHQRGYTETGAGDINLRVKSKNYDFLESGLGVKVERPLSYKGGTLVPEVHTQWLHELFSPRMSQTASYTASGSGEFTTPGPRPNANTFNVGGGVSLLSCTCGKRTWSLEAVYDYNWRTDGYSAHQVMMRVTSRF
ncbi:MAG: autotransporter domain-containing protein [Candidatus Omnitrophica bacterium]|nr:autotransporter domain-containing protein [Candidatus Omnitrophota bacterium]